MSLDQEGPFDQQQRELTEAFNLLKNVVNDKISQILESTTIEENMMKQFRSEIDKQAEMLHLSISNYSGDCDRRKQKIEAKISENVDVVEFGLIGERLMNL